MAILAASITSVLIASPETPSAGEKFLISPVREWTYELTLHGFLGVHFDPYLVNSVLLSSNVTHGARQTYGKTGTTTFTLRAPAEPAKGEQSLELDAAAKKALFGPAITKTSFAVVKGTDPLAENHPWDFKSLDKDGTYKQLLPFPQPVVALELRGTMDMKDDEPWVLSELLAFVPEDGKTPVDHLGWTSALVTEPVVVPAGTFKRVFISRRPRGDGQYTHRHTLESWVAEGVGLIKLVALNRENKPIYSLQLISYK